MLDLDSEILIWTKWRIILTFRKKLTGLHQWVEWWLTSYHQCTPKNLGTHGGRWISSQAIYGCSMAACNAHALVISMKRSFMECWNLGQLQNWVTLHCFRRQLQVFYCWSRTWSYSNPMYISISSCLLELIGSYGKWCNC